MTSNHIIDPSYFDDAIEAFSFNYEWWHINNMVVDDYGNQKSEFEKLTIIGSLQPQTYRRELNKEANVETKQYNFYCKSIYRIGVGDFIHYDNNWLIVRGVTPLDEYGVRSAELESTTISQYQDLTEAVKALTGEFIP